MFGPSRTVSITPPSERDVEESIHLAEFVDEFATPLEGNATRVLTLLNIAAKMLLDGCNLPPPPPSSSSLSTLHPSPPPPASTPTVRSPPELQPTWVQLKMFGSAGLESNVQFSDIDAYDGDFHSKITPLSTQLPFPTPFSGTWGTAAQNERCTLKKYATTTSQLHSLSCRHFDYLL